MKRMGIAFAGLLLALSLTSCDPQEPGRGKGGKPTIALVMKSLANEFFKTMEEGARKHQQEHADRYELVAVGMKDERDMAEQMSLVEQMIARNVDAIVIAPVDSKALISVCKRAKDAGIVVVNIDNRFDRGTLAEKGVSFPFFGPDNRKGARLAGEHAARQLKKGDEVAIVEGIPNAINGVQRKQGFEDAVKAAGLVIASSQTAYWEDEKAEKVVSGMITQHPDIKAVLCANDSMALGAVAALKAAGKIEEVKVVGFDNLAAVQRLIREGRILCTVDQHADLIATHGIECALDILDGNPPPDQKETPVELITIDELPPEQAK